MANKEKLVMWITALISIKESPLFPYDGIELIWTLFQLHDYSQKTRPDSLIAMPKWAFAFKKKKNENARRAS